MVHVTNDLYSVRSQGGEARYAVENNGMTGGRPPAEMAGIPLPKGKNRWMAIIEASAAMQQGVKKGSNQP